MSRQDPLIVHPESTVVLSPRYCGSIGWYAAVAAYGGCRVDYDMPFDKRLKATHRCDIVDTHGVLSLTVPIEKPAGIERRLRWSDILVSPHGEWWNVHRVSLESAYGRTPFFEFYIDRFMPALTRSVMTDFPRLEDLDRFIDGVIRDILGIEVDREPSDGAPTVDMRKENFNDTPLVPYYQVRADRLGFVGGLSVLDLLFNLGPEAPLYLQKIINSNF